MGVAYEFFRGNERKAFALEVKAEVNVGRVESVPAVDDNFSHVIERFGGVFTKAKIVFARFFEEILADGDSFAFGEYLCGVSVHIEPARCQRQNSFAELDVSALAAAIKHHAVFAIQAYY